MCGILGLINFKKEISDFDRNEFCEANVKLSHRGPDFQSVATVHERILFGHNRLSIIDLNQGSNQPFMKKTTNDALIFNGEIYNYQFLKKDSIFNSIQFESSGDTEVLFEGFRLQKMNFVEKMNGMFAFAFWDSKEEKLWLVRDRLGIKPIYLYRDSEKMVFSSEIRPLLKFSTKVINREKIYEWLLFQTNPSLDSIVQNINQIKPGSWLTCSINGEIKTGEYYSLQNQFKTKNHFEIDLLRGIINDSVKDRLVSDVPIGAFLSGGVDSSVVVAAMRESTTSEIKTFSVGFEKKDIDESEIAKKVADKFNTNHSELRYSANEIVQLIPNAVNQLDYPTGDAINTWLVSKATKEAGITVALSGLGGDELFGGYPAFSRTDSKWLNAEIVLKLIDYGAKITGKRIREFQKIALTNKMKNYRNVHSMISRLVFLPDTAKRLIHVTVPLNQFVDLDSISHSELFFYTQPLLLRDTDQTSMAHALEVRVPLLDYRLVNYMASVDKTYRYKANAPYSKYYLVEAFKDVLPNEVYQRKKQGFVLPMDSWIHNELKNYTKESLFDSPLSSYLDGSTIQALWADYLHGKSYVKWSMIWSLAVLGRWLQNQNF